MSVRIQDPAGGAEETARELGALRDRILAAPEIVLEDSEIMEALLRPVEPGGRNVVDLRAAQISRLESRLAALRQAHSDVVEAALDSMNGVEQVHRAALALMETECAESLAARVRGRLPGLLHVEEARLCLCLDDPVLGDGSRRVLAAHTAAHAPSSWAGRWIDGVRRRMNSLWAPALEPELRRSDADKERLDPALVLLPIEAIRSRCPEPLRRPSGPKRLGGAAPGRPVAIRIREAEPEDRMLFGPAINRLEAVAAITLDLGPSRALGALVFGAAEREALQNSHMVELLAFLGGVVERLIRTEDAAQEKALAAELADHSVVSLRDHDQPRAPR